MNEREHSSFCLPTYYTTYRIYPSVPIVLLYKMSQMTDIADEDYEYAYSENDDEDETGMDIVDFGDELVSPTHKKAKHNQKFPSITPRNSDAHSDVGLLSSLDMNGQEIRMLSAEEIFPIMKMRVDEVSEVLGIPPSAAMVLMREYKWAKEHLFERFYSDPERTTTNAGVHARCQKYEYLLSASKTKATRKSSRGKVSLKTCLICFQDDFSAEDMISMPCNHEFCRGCWRGFVEVMIGDGPTCVRKDCPAHGCSEVVTEEEVEQAAPELLSKYESFQVKSFVELSKESRWCTGPGCDRIAVCKQSTVTAGAIVAVCDMCTTAFCIKCGEEPHAPITCRDLEKWNIKCRNESETANWILANTKSCPFCNSRIEKNQGCNHMTCQQCRKDFCWICLGKWSEHDANTGGYYRCNKFSEKESNDKSDVAKAKRELDRYLHYYKRFSAHAQAEKFARDQLRETETKMALLQERSVVATWVDVEFLKAANEQLVECRRVLKFSYAFAYYLSEDKEKEMQKQRFEYHQEMLERFTEKLSELSEKSIASMDRTEVVNQTRVVDCFTKNILKYVEDGMEDLSDVMT